MFNTLYRCPRTIARHENGPLAESRRRYLEYLAAQGAAIHTIRAAAGVIYRATILMKLDGSSPVERKNVQRAAKRWAHRWYRNASSRGPEQTDKEFRQTTCNWLRFAGRLRESDRVTPPYQQEIDALCRYMEVERGLSPATIATQRHYLKKFFKHTKRKQLISIRIADVERFFVFLGKEGWTRAGIRGIAHYLRMFFRYGEQMGSTKPESPMRFVAHAFISMNNFRSVLRGQMCSGFWLAEKQIGSRHPRPSHPAAARRVRIACRRSPTDSFRRHKLGTKNDLHHCNETAPLCPCLSAHSFSRRCDSAVHP